MHSLNDKIDFKAGAVLLVDKPYGWSSFQVVNKLRYPLSNIYNQKRFKVGHAGTLDPLATGLLVICTGKKTKEITTLIQDEKEYDGIIKLGATTPSYDLETEIDQTYPIDHITEELVESVRNKFIGKLKQRAPIFSAKKIDGKRAYLKAREGENFEMKENDIEIKSLDLKLIADEIHFTVQTTKGTYIRSLAYDLGKALSSGAHLSKLRRLKSGDFSLHNAHSIDDWLSIIENNHLVNPTS